MQWKATLAPPVEALLTLIESVVFCNTLDGQIFIGVKQRKDAFGIMETSPFSDRAVSIDSALEERAKGDKYAMAGQGEDQGMEEEEDGGVNLEVLKSDSAVVDPPAGVVQEIQHLKAEPKQVVEKFVSTCWNKIETIIQLEVEPDSGVADAVKKRLQASAIQELRMQEKHPGQERYVMFVYDLKAAGEASSHPQTRLPPLRENGGHLKDFVRGALQANGEPHSDDLGPHDLFVIPNGGKEGLSLKSLLGGFADTDGNQLTKQTRVLRVSLDEEGFFGRFEKVRGFNFNLTEDYFCVSKDFLDMPVRHGKHFPKRSNRNNNLGPVACPPFVPECSHMLPWKVKKEVFSEKSKLGCRVGGAAPANSEKVQRKPDSSEPLCYHQLPWKFWAEMIHGHNVQGVVDFTVGAGYIAEAALRERVPYLGFCQTVVHCNVVRQYLFGRLWGLMQEAGCEHYCPELHEALAGPQAAAASSCYFF